MSVLINMKAPDETIFCPCLDRETGYCQVPDVLCCYGLGDAKCPLVPVQPHGDLIERDKLREKEFVHAGDAYAVVMSRDIRNAPTIIPAEEGE